MSLRTTLLSCLTAFACVAMILVYVHKYLRYQIIGNDKAVFVLDRQTTLMHHCNKQNCQLITPQGTNIEQMRQLAGIPTAQQVMQQQKKKQIEKCRCEAEQKDNLFPQVKLNVSSFQSLEPQIMSPKALQQRQKNMAQQINMPVMMQKQQPQQPFPSSDMSAQVIKTGGAPKQQQKQNNNSSSNDSSGNSYGSSDQSASSDSSGDSYGSDNQSASGDSSGDSYGSNNQSASGDSSGDSYGSDNQSASGDSSGDSYGSDNQSASGDSSGDSYGSNNQSASGDSSGDSYGSNNQSASGDSSGDSYGSTQTTSAPGIPEIPDMPSST